MKLAYYVTVQVQVPAVVQLPATALGRQLKIARVPEPLTPTWETYMQFLAPGLGLVESCVWWAFVASESADGTALSLSFQLHKPEYIKA